VRPLEMEIVNLKRQIQMNKQSIGQHKYQLEGGVEVLRPVDVSTCKTSSTLHQWHTKIAVGELY